MNKAKVIDNLKKLFLLMSIVFTLFHLYAAGIGRLAGITHKAIHLGLVLVCFFLYEIIKDIQSDKSNLTNMIINCILIFFALAATLYIIKIDETASLRAGIIYNTDIIFGLMLILAVLVATKRNVGNILFYVVIGFIAYGFLGQYLPGVLRHSGLSVNRFISLTYMTTDGIYGTALYASAKYIVLFSTLGAIMNETGIGDYFTSIATYFFGRMVGGPAKIAVVASGFFGSINGSAIANVIGTGTFTIPLMKRSGFSSEYAAGVEAAASTGGQIMPPIMGATAFLLAEFIGIPYIEVAKAALLPAILYYLAILFSVDAYARKHNIGTADVEIPTKREMLRKSYLLSPIVFLVLAMVVFNWTISKVGFYTIILTIIITSLSKETRITKERAIRVFESTTRGSFPVAIACSVVGIIIAVVMGSNLGFRLSSILTETAGDSTLLLLILTMLTSLVLGMGMPTTAAYLVLAVLVAPALAGLGIPAIAAHLFLLYFGIISTVTPPVALAAYAAAGIAECNPTKAGFKAFRLALSGFILPYIFVYDNTLLMMGSPFNIIIAFLSAMFGVFMLSCGLERYYIKWQLSIPESIILSVASIGLIIPGIVTDLVGLVIGIGIYISCHLRGKKDNTNSVSY